MSAGAGQSPVPGVQAHCLAGLEHKHVACNATHDWQHLLLQRDFTVIPAVHFHARFNKEQLRTVQLRDGIETISDLEKLADNAEAV